MDCSEAIMERRSIRKYKDTNIESDILDEILNAARMAPSAGNLQARDFIVVSNKITKQKLSEAALDQSFIGQAPVVIVAAANIERSSRRYGPRGELYAIQDATAAVMNLLLAAHAHGLATCWVGAFDDHAVAQILGLPGQVRPIAIIPVGYPDEKPSAPSRMGLDKVIHKEMW